MMLQILNPETTAWKRIKEFPKTVDKINCKKKKIIGPLMTG